MRTHTVYTALNMYVKMYISQGLTKEELLSLCLSQDRGRRETKYLHDTGQLFHLILSGKQRVASVELGQMHPRQLHMSLAMLYQSIPFARARSCDAGQLHPPLAPPRN